MKILWIPQVSSKSADGKLLLDSDSNIKFLLNMVCSAFGLCNDIDVFFEHYIDKKDFDMFKVDGIKKVFCAPRAFTDAYTERLNFNMEYVTKIFLHANYDVIFVNEPTHVVQYKQIFKNTNVKIVTYCHWLAMDNMKDIELRQVEGFIAADACLFNSNYAICRVLERYKNIDGIENAKLYKLQPPTFSDYCPTFSNYCKNKKDDEEIAIIYNHRISTDPYYKKAFDIFDEMLDNIEGRGVELPKIFLTNPSGKNLDIDTERYTVLNLDSEQYEDFLVKHFLIHVNTFFESKGMWSMSTADAANTNNFCLLPYKFGYAEIMNRTYFGYCETPEEMEEKLEQIIVNGMPFDYDNSYVYRHNPVNVGNKLNDILHDVIVGDYNKRPWGYFDVLLNNKNVCVKVLKVNANELTSLQRHNFKNEEWYVIDGLCEVYIGHEIIQMHKGEKINVPAQTNHRIAALDKDVTILEVATSDVVVSESDIERLADDYGR